MADQTSLTPSEELQFQLWARVNDIRDVDHPDSHYDYRGYWKDLASQGRDQTQINAEDQRLHFPDTYKQHGHPSFSVESRYSRGPWDGGQWIGETLVPPPEASHVTTQRLRDLLQRLTQRTR
jgi:hypothetical protein